MRVWIGTDEVREPGAADVCARSIRRFIPAAEIERLALQHPLVREHYTRMSLVSKATRQRIDIRDGKPFSTDFSFTRFFVPFFEGFEGWALFCDGDIYFRYDIRQLFDLADDRFAAMCVKHEHHPERTGEIVKMGGVLQTVYRRKNWSSLVLWNCGHPKNKDVIPFVVNHAEGSYLHAFGWLDDHDIGPLPEEWNWLVGVSPTTEGARIAPGSIKGVHYTRGVPGQLYAVPSPFDAEWLALAEQHDAVPAVK